MNKEVRVFIDKYIKEKVEYGNQRMKQIMATLEENQSLVYGEYMAKVSVPRDSPPARRVRTESATSATRQRSRNSGYCSSKPMNDDEHVDRWKFKNRPKPKKALIYDEFVIPDDIKRRYYNKLLKLKISENFAQMKRAEYKITTTQHASQIEVKQPPPPSPHRPAPTNGANHIRQVQDYIDTHSTP
jgi:hypothetical protein